MSDLISREALMEYARNHVGHTIDCNDIARFPAVDAEPVRHGQWEKICTSSWRWKHDGAHVVNRFKFKHNDCGKVVAKAEPYCPKCGAKMDGGAEHV